MSLHDKEVGLPTLKLFALQDQGQARDGVWQWPGTAFKVSLDAVLAGLGARDAHTLAHTRYCTLERMGSATQAFWLLGNSSHQLVCSVNQRLLMAGSQIRLDHGDAIEVGLTRMVVSLDGSDHPPETAPSFSNTSIAVDEQSFVLTDLDAVADVSSAPAHGRYGSNRADFSDLISFTPEENLPPAEPIPAPSALANTPNLQEAPATGQPPSYQDKVSDLLAQFGGDGEAAKQTAVPMEANPLEALHAQYLYKLRNPTHSDEDSHWQTMVQGDQAKQPDPMQHWMHLAGDQPGLDDLLGQSHSIARVIDALDPLGTSDVLKPEPFDSVMHLFAPENHRLDANDPLATLVQPSLPGLTRREHHSLSLDSAMPFTGGEDIPPQPTKP